MTAEQRSDQVAVPSAPTMQQIQAFEAELLKHPQIDIPVEHTFGPGFYARTIRIPAGAYVTGKVHATEHLFAISQGEILLVTEDGRVHAKAPFQCVARPGVKRVGIALTDVVCTNFHLTTETDLAKLEALLIEQPTLGAPETQGALT